MELRAHHLLCIPMYQGHGYSEEFCVHMTEVIKKIKTTDEPIHPLASPDVICECCPNLRRKTSGQKKVCQTVPVNTKRGLRRRIKTCWNALA